MARPSGYDPAFADQAVKLCKLGATDDEIADFFDVSVRTIYRWKHDHEEFCQALKAGKAEADERVQRSLYHNATGYAYTEQQAIKVKVEAHKEVVEVVDVERHKPSDTTAAIFWLKNRRSDDWRDKREVAVRDDRTEDQIDAAIERRLEKLAETGEAGLLN